VAGSVTTTNTGTKKIEIGHQICWDVPQLSPDGFGAHNPAQAGEPGNKVRLVTVPYEDTLKDSKSIVVQQFEQDTSLQTLITGPFSSSRLVQVLDIIDDQYTADARSRIIGTALSKAAPGQPFDMLLRYSH